MQPAATGDEIAEVLEEITPEQWRVIRAAIAA